VLPAIVLGISTTVAAAAGSQADPVATANGKTLHRIPQATSGVVVDGRLDEPVWESALRLELPYEVNPGDNLSAAVRTEALLTYDGSHFYAAFKAGDPSPSTIRARLTDRDTAFQDDFVGVVVDTFNDERRAFEFFVNPVGVQMDLVVDDVAGSEDSSWDAIWESAGSLTPEGYMVEISIPFTSLRFQRGDGDQVWGIDLVRVYPRDRRFLFAMNPRDRNISCYLCQVAKVAGFSGAEPGRNLEITPTLTVIRTDQRSDNLNTLPGPPGPNFFPHTELKKRNPEPDLGLTVKWGVTPNLIMSGAANPDFSQVEADAAQLDVNEQFALFFPEKRPFFLEGADFFETPLQAVYTRTVADPGWSVKLSGKEGKNVMGAFVARDDRTNLLFPGSQGSSGDSLEQEATAGVLRYRRDVGKNSALGGLVTARAGEDYFNGVAGVDALIRGTPKDTIRFQALGSETSYGDTVAKTLDLAEGDFTGHALSARYSHYARMGGIWAFYRDLGADFRADLGFVPQVDIRAPEIGAERIWWGDPNDRFSRIAVSGNWDQTTDQAGNLIERETEAYLNLSGPKQSFLSIGGRHRIRAFQEAAFDQGFVNLFFEMWTTRNLYWYLEGGVSKRIDFAFIDPNDAGATRQGDEIRLKPFLRYNLGRHVRLEASHELRSLGIDGGTLFRANLSQVRLAYQLSVRAFLRAIVQYGDVSRETALYPECVDDPAGEPCPFVPETRDLFAQLLFSYKINPQTALFVGYTDSKLGLEDVDLLRTDRTFFFKVGRAWVF